jgi:hypothetical protein
MDKTWLPWRDYHEALSLQHLIEVADLFRKVWRRVSELHEPSAGDNMWAMSCRAFARCAFQLNQQVWPWLLVIEQRKMQLIVCIGSVPVRFYHGDSGEVPDRYSFAPKAEQSARQLLLNFDDRIQEGVLVRIATQTDSKGVPLSVSLVLYEEASGNVLNAFTIPEALGATGIVQAFPTLRPTPGIVPPKPAVRPKFGRAKGQEDDAE